ETSNARGEWPARYMVNGPQGTFYTDDLKLADTLLHAYVKDDDWTVTDMRDRAPLASPPPAAARGDVRRLVAKLAAHVRPTCSELWYEAQAFLAAEGVQAVDAEQRAQNTGLLDAIEQYAAAVEQDVRSKLRFTSYAARESAKQNRKKKKEAVRSALAAEGVQAGEVAQRARVETALRDALTYVGQRADGDLPVLAERCELWMRESQSLLQNL